MSSDEQMIALAGIKWRYELIEEVHQRKSIRKRKPIVNGTNGSPLNASLLIIHASYQSLEVCSFFLLVPPLFLGSAISLFHFVIPFLPRRSSLNLSISLSGLPTYLGQANMTNELADFQ